MKTSVKLFICVVFISAIASCTKNPYKILRSKDGSWTATTETTYPGFGTIITTSTMNFYTGSATVIDTAGNQSGFEWVYNTKSAQIVATNYVGDFIYETIYKVSDITDDSEKWTFKEFQIDGVTQSTSDDYTSVISLERK